MAWRGISLESCTDLHVREIEKQGEMKQNEVFSLHLIFPSTSVLVPNSSWLQQDHLLRHQRRFQLLHILMMMAGVSYKGDRKVQSRNITRSLVKGWNETASKIVPKEDMYSCSNQGFLTTKHGFIGPGRVLAKIDSRLNIEKDDPVHGTQKWQGVKYFVDSAIVKIKSSLHFKQDILRYTYFQLHIFLWGLHLGLHLGTT